MVDNCKIVFIFLDSENFTTSKIYQYDDQNDFLNYIFHCIYFSMTIFHMIFQLLLIVASAPYAIQQI